MLQRLFLMWSLGINKLDHTSKNDWISFLFYKTFVPRLFVENQAQLV